MAEPYYAQINGGGVVALPLVGSGSNINSLMMAPEYINGGLGGLFTARVDAGFISKGGGSFKIDHPLDPSNKYLSHSFVESPDMMNIYNGIAFLDGQGEAWVQLPNYFQALNQDFRYELTSVGKAQAGLYIAQEVSDNRFRISGGQPSGRVSWQVTGIRHDAFANSHRVKVEEEKSTGERGSNLYDEPSSPPEAIAPGKRSSEKQPNGGATTERSGPE
jgi:hypothetical protein